MKTNSHLIGISSSLMVLVLGLGPLASPVQAEEEPTFRVEKNLSFVTSDGIRLAADLYTPLETGPFPTVLIRTPYDKKQMSFIAEYLGERGYAVVVQDVRGKWKSEGEFIPFLNERVDGEETLDWVAAQPWCNGRVGMWGSSYLGFTGLSLADLRHPALKTVMSISGWIHSEEMAFPGGALHLMLSLPWLITEETEKQRALDDYDIEELFEYLPLRDALSSVGIESALWKDNDTLAAANADFDYAKVDIPILHVTGWFDFVGPSSFEVYRRMREESTAPQKLLIGPWLHDQYYTDIPEVGDVDMGPTSILDVTGTCELSLRWFDFWLRDTNNGIMEEPPVRAFIMNENRWRDFESWPPASLVQQRWYLTSTGSAKSADGNGELLAELPTAATRDSFTFDPFDPVPTQGGANFHFFGAVSGMLDQEEIEARGDVLVYSSDVLTQPLDLLGDMKVVLQVATEGIDTDFTAKLVDVDRDGYALNVADGILRLSAREEEAAPVQPGWLYEITIDLGTTGLRIPAGHRLRLQVSSSNFPKYDRNPNTGEPAFEARKLVPVQQTVYSSPERPSYVEVTALEDAERRASR
jgi:putative CocE/NonD family hydrolase